MDADNTTALLERIEALEQALADAEEKAQARGKKPWYSKMHWFNVTAALAGTASLLLESTGLHTSLGVLAVGVPLVNLWLRQLTSQPIVWGADDASDSR